jgi:hypothetical protein
MFKNYLFIFTGEKQQFYLGIKMNVIDAKKCIINLFETLTE